MSTQTALGHSFPMPCKRCGGALYRKVDYCPYCGAVHPLVDTSAQRDAVATKAPPAMTAPARRFDGAPALPSDADAAARSAQIDAAIARELAARESRRLTPLVSPSIAGGQAAAAYADDPPFPPYAKPQMGRNVMLAIAAVFLLALTYVLYVLFSDNVDADDMGEHAAVATLDARSTTGTIEQSALAHASHSAATVKRSLEQPAAIPPPPTLAAAPAAPTLAANAAPAALSAAAPSVPAQTATSLSTQAATSVPAQAAPNARPSTPPAAATPAAPQAATPVVTAAATATPAPTVSVMPSAPARPAPQFRDVSQALQAARVAFRANDLSSAQAALAAAQSLQPGNADAQHLADEMRPLAVRRDNALQAAQACVAQQTWPCARQHANEALAIDGGNDAAKLILERVIRETGWAPLPPHASAAPHGGQALAPAQAQPAAAPAPAAQLRAPLPANGRTIIAAVRQRAVTDAGWTHAPSNGAAPGQ